MEQQLLDEFQRLLYLRRGELTQEVARTEYSLWRRFLTELLGGHDRIKLIKIPGENY
jgi:hypothetical protein